MNTLLIITILVAANLTLFFFLYWQPRKKRKQQAGGLFFQSSMGPIFYQTNGHQKNTVVLLHGLGASSFSWRKLIPLLEKDFKVITIDLWGFGKSTKAHPRLMSLDQQIHIIFELLDELGVNEFDIIGNSMGAHIALWMGKCFPERVKHLVVIAPATHPKLVPTYIGRFSWLSNLTPLVINRTVVKNMVLNVLGDPHNLSTEMIDAYFEPYRDPDAHRSFAASLRILQDQRVYNSLTSIEIPTLTLWGERDRVIQRHVIDDLVKKLPFVELKIHPKSGHSPMEEHPEWCIEQIIPFLKS